MAHAWIEGIAILPLAWLALACATPREPVTGGEPPKQVDPKPLDPRALAEYAGAYRVAADRFVYLQPWIELGADHLTWFDESGEVRALSAGAADQFDVGPAAGVAAPAEARVTFRRGPGGEIAGFVRRPIRPAGDAPGEAPAAGGDAGPLEAKRVRLWSETDLTYKNGDVTLAGTLMVPAGGGRHPAMVLVHGSGPLDRGAILPFANFLVRRGIALFGYDKRGVGGSTGDWHVASFDALAADALAAVELLRARDDIDPDRVGLFGVSQGGWVGPLAASRSPHVAFVVSVSGPGTTPGVQNLDHLENELRAYGVDEPGLAEAVALTRLMHAYTRTGAGWDQVEAAVARAQGSDWFFPELVAPRDHWSYGFLRLVIDYDPVPVLKSVRCPVLALFGGLDLLVPAGKNRAIWESALKAGENRDHSIRLFPAGNHLLWEAGKGTMREMPGLKRFVPGYADTIREWVLNIVAP